MNELGKKHTKEIASLKQQFQKEVTHWKETVTKEKEANQKLQTELENSHRNIATSHSNSEGVNQTSSDSIRDADSSIIDSGDMSSSRSHGNGAHSKPGASTDIHSKSSTPPSGVGIYTSESHSNTSSPLVSESEGTNQQLSQSEASLQTNQGSSQNDPQVSHCSLCI